MTCLLRYCSLAFDFRFIHTLSRTTEAIFLCSPCDPAFPEVTNEPFIIYLFVLSFWKFYCHSWVNLTEQNIQSTEDTWSIRGYDDNNSLGYPYISSHHMVDY